MLVRLVFPDGEMFFSGYIRESKCFTDAESVLNQ